MSSAKSANSFSADFSVGFDPVSFGADFLASNYASSKQLSGERKLLDQQFEFNKRMMKNRHTWEVQDLKKAGLDPVLSARGGAPSMAGVSGGSASAVKPDMSSAIQAKRLKKEFELMDAQIANVKAGTSKTRSEDEYQRLLNIVERLSMPSRAVDSAISETKGYAFSRYIQRIIGGAGAGVAGALGLNSALSASRRTPLPSKKPYRGIKGFIFKRTTHRNPYTGKDMKK